ncbi:MAG: MFS transporter [Bacillota bacterium]
MSYAAPPGGFRTFLMLWASQSVSVFGTALSIFAINIWLVQVVYPLPEQRAELGWALAAVGLAMGVPATIAAPIAGALADRMDRKRLMLSMDLVNGVIAAVMAYLMGTDLLQLWMVLIILATLSVTHSIHGSAFDTSYAMLVPDEQLPRANGMMQTMWSLSSVLSPAIAATIIALPSMARQGLLPGSIGTALAGLHNGATLALTVDAITFFLAGLVLAFLVIPSPKRADLEETDRKKKPSIWADVRFGAAYIWRRPPLLWLLATFAVVNLGLQMGVFLPLLVKVDLAPDWTARGMSYEAALAALNTAMAVGGLAGGFIVSLWGGARKKRVLVLMGSMMLTGLAQIWLGFSSILYVGMVAIFLWNFFGPVSNAHSQAIWQGQVPREMQGRVFAIRRVIAWSLGPLGQVLAGLLAGLVNPGLGLALLGGMIALFTFGQFFNPQVMRVEDKAYLDRLAGEAAVGQ